MQARVSILLPAYQAASSLEPCLRSIVRQTEPHFECIVVDDGSSDETAARARSLTAGDDRFRLVSTPHRGLVSALMVGLEHCSAPLVARMDADDSMHPGRLRAQADFLDANPALSGAGSQVRIFPRRGLRPGRRAYERWLCSIRTAQDVRRESFVECPIAHPTLVLRREVLQKLGYRDMGWPEDYDLVLRLLAAGHELAVVPRRLLAWRDSPSRLSRTHEAYAIERFTACKAAHLCQTFLRDHTEYALWGYGDTGRALRRALARHDRHPSLIIELHPGRLGQRIHGAPVVAPEALARLPRRPIVASVAGAGPRARIRDALAALGFCETRDFVCAA